jgi:hypothetical protein
MARRVVGGFFCSGLFLLKYFVEEAGKAGQAGAGHSVRPISERPRLGVPLSLIERAAESPVWLDQGLDMLAVSDHLLLVNQRESTSSPVIGLPDSAVGDPQPYARRPSNALFMIDQLGDSS